jgi:hypothetical protein
VRKYHLVAFMVLLPTRNFAGWNKINPSDGDYTLSRAGIETISFLRAYNGYAIKIKLDICKACQERQAHKSNRRSAHNNEPRGWQVVPLNQLQVDEK